MVCVRIRGSHPTPRLFPAPRDLSPTARSQNNPLRASPEKPPPASPCPESVLDPDPRGREANPTSPQEPYDHERILQPTIFGVQAFLFARQAIIAATIIFMKSVLAMQLMIFAYSFLLSMVIIIEIRPYRE